MLSVSAIKTIAQIVGGLGASRVVGQIIRNNTVVLTPMDVILIKAGSIVIGSMAVKGATNHVSETIDDIVENLRERANKDEDVIEHDENEDGA